MGAQGWQVTAGQWYVPLSSPPHQLALPQAAFSSFPQGLPGNRGERGDKVRDLFGGWGAREGSVPTLVTSHRALLAGRRRGRGAQRRQGETPGLGGEGGSAVPPRLTPTSLLHAG